MAQAAQNDGMPRHRADRPTEAGFTYGDPGTEQVARPGKDCRRAWAWGNPDLYLHVRFADVIGQAHLADELIKLDERLRVHAEGGEQTLPQIPEWLANATSYPVPQPA